MFSFFWTSSWAFSLVILRNTTPELLKHTSSSTLLKLYQTGQYRLVFYRPLVEYLCLFNIPKWYLWKYEFSRNCGVVRLFPTEPPQLAQPACVDSATSSTDLNQCKLVELFVVAQSSKLWFTDQKVVCSNTTTAKILWLGGWTRPLIFSSVVSCISQIRKCTWLPINYLKNLQ